MNRVFSDVSDALVLPKIIRLGKNLYCACFVLMKLMPARLILRQAARDSLLGPDTVVVESTSGTFGLALALLCNKMRRRLILVSDPAVDAALKRRLEDLGAHVDICERPAEVGGYQRARLDRLAYYRGRYTDHYWPGQYKNLGNPAAYAALAELLVGQLGRVGCLVGTVGSGGSMCGTSTYLRQINPDLIAVGVDTDRSVLFGRPDGSRLIRGLGNSLMPPNLDHSIFDEVHWLTAAEIIAATRMLHRREGLFLGPTSGAAFLVASECARRSPDSVVVFIAADEGYRYADTVYDDRWIEAKQLQLEDVSQRPMVVSQPSEAEHRWACMAWNRRSLEAVLGHPHDIEVAQ